MSAYQKNLVTAVLFVVIGALLSWDAFRYSYNSSFFLRGLALTLLGLGLSYGLILLVKKPSVEGVAVEDDARNRDMFFGAVPAFKVFAIVSAYVLLLTATGFLIATLVFAFVGQVVFAGEFRRRHLAYALCMTFVIFYLFFEALGVRMPAAPLSLDPFFRTS